MGTVEEREGKEQADYIDEVSHRLWLALKRLRDLIALCIDGFCLNQEVEFDVAINVMEFYKSNIDEILNMVSLEAEKFARRTKETKD